eukprot:2286541-Pyramimonas_sp.AAC.1
MAGSRGATSVSMMKSGRGKKSPSGLVCVWRKNGSLRRSASSGRWPVGLGREMAGWVAPRTELP